MSVLTFMVVSFCSIFRRLALKEVEASVDPREVSSFHSRLNIHVDLFRWGRPLLGGSRLPILRGFETGSVDPGEAAGVYF